MSITEISHTKRKSLLLWLFLFAYFSFSPISFLLNSQNELLKKLLLQPMMLKLKMTYVFPTPLILCIKILCMLILQHEPYTFLKFY